MKKNRLIDVVLKGSLLIALGAFWPGNLVSAPETATPENSAPAAQGPEKLVENSTFDHPDGPLTGWITDYAWTGNSNYVGNKDCVVAYGGAIKFTPKHKDAEGAKMECIPIPFERGYRYTAKLDVKDGPYRVYFAGYKWKPGIRPHDNPELGELRMIYKSKAATGEGRKRLELSLPGVELSSLAKKHLKHVRFVTLYIWFMNEGYADNVVVERVPDPSVSF